MNEPILALILKEMIYGKDIVQHHKDIYHNELYASIERVEFHQFISRGEMIAFQLAIMETFKEHILESGEPTDDLLEDDDVMVRDVYLIYREFINDNPGANVVSMFPVDLKGSFGFVVQCNDM